MKDEYFWSMAFILIDNDYLSYNECELLSYNNIKLLYNFYLLNNNLVSKI